MSEISTLTQKESQFNKWFEVHSALGVSLMMHLYNRMDGAYPHKWRSNFPTEQAIENWSVTWAEAFEEEGIKPADIKAGIKAVRTRFDWPPSCAEFIKACKPAVDQLVAYYQAIAGLQARKRGDMGEWSSSAVYWAATKLAFELNSQTYSQVKARWESTLQEYMNLEVLAPIPKPMIAIAAPGKGEMSREHAAKLISECRANDIVKGPQSNHRRWIEKIFSRQKARDSTLPSISISFANEAKNVRPA